jgi:hypothetical protein
MGDQVTRARAEPVQRKMKIHWINMVREETQHDPSARGYYRSVEGRFGIHPTYRHTVYPDAFVVTDRIKGDQSSNDTIGECKAWALARIEREISEEQN